MKFRAGQRGDRRRLAAALTESASPTATVTPLADQTLLPVPASGLNHGPQQLSGWLPVGTGSLILAAAFILTLTTIALSVSLGEPLLGRPLLPEAGGFPQTVRVLRDALDVRRTESLASWMAQSMLLAAAAVALIIRSLQRHRRDDFKARFRSWGCLAGVWSMASAAGGLPLGSAVGLAVEEATGTTLGPGGYGWWLTLAGGGLLLTLLWAILPMQERLPTAVSIGSGLLAWCCAVVCAWQGASTQWLATIGPAAWTWGAALILIGMLIAGRSTVREIRGQTRRRQRPARQPQRRTVTPGQHPQHARSHTAADVAGADTGPDFEVAGSDGDPAPPWEADREAIDSSAESADGDDGPVDDEEDPQESAHRKLSKAERRRLRKLARSGRAA
jgi:hypothetical protein